MHSAKGALRRKSSVGADGLLPPCIARMCRVMVQLIKVGWVRIFKYFGKGSKWAGDRSNRKRLQAKRETQGSASCALGLDALQSRALGSASTLSWIPGCPLYWCAHKTTGRRDGEMTKK